MPRSRSSRTPPRLLASQVVVLRSSSALSYRRRCSISRQVEVLLSILRSITLTTRQEQPSIVWARSSSTRSLPSQPDALDLVECQGFLATIIELGGAGAFVRGHRLRMLERPAILQIRRNAGRAEGMAADRRFDAGGDRTPAHHPPGVGLIHRLVGQRGSFPALGGAE